MERFTPGGNEIRQQKREQWRNRTGLSALRNQSSACATMSAIILSSSPTGSLPGKNARAQLRHKAEAMHTGAIGTTIHACSQTGSVERLLHNVANVLLANLGQCDVGNRLVRRKSLEPLHVLSGQRHRNPEYSAHNVIAVART